MGGRLIIMKQQSTNAVFVRVHVQWDLTGFIADYGHVAKNEVDERSLHSYPSYTRHVQIHSQMKR